MPGFSREINNKNTQDFILREVAVVIPLGGGRKDNIEKVLESLKNQELLSKNKLNVFIVCDGKEATNDVSSIKSYRRNIKVNLISIDKTSRGDNPPRNIGVEFAKSIMPDLEWVWFIDSDVVLEATSFKAIRDCIFQNNKYRILCGSYDWLKPKKRDFPFSSEDVLMREYREDMFSRYFPQEILYYNLGAALANFSGNLIWPVSLFEKIGGFHRNLSAGRVDDGECGLRASALGIGTSFLRDCKGHHLWHEINSKRVYKINKEEVPLINKWHPWVQDEGLILRNLDGTRFNFICAECNLEINSLEIWKHNESHINNTVYIPLYSENGIVGRAIVDKKYLYLAKYRWSLSTKGYAHRKISVGPRNNYEQKGIFMHRQICNVLDNPEVEVDHINGNRLDNRRKNLRILEKGQNSQNRNYINPNGSSVFRGVSKSGGKLL